LSETSLFELLTRLPPAWQLADFPPPVDLGSRDHPQPWANTLTLHQPSFEPVLHTTRGYPQLFGRLLDGQHVASLPFTHAGILPNPV
jgi:hypothetical protein